MQYLHSELELKRALIMPITQFLDDCEFDCETKRVVSLAFEMAREALQLGDQGNLAEKLPKGSSSWQKTGNATPTFYANP
jgi:hypothetical protein